MTDPDRAETMPSPRAKATAVDTRLARLQAFKRERRDDDHLSRDARRMLRDSALGLNPELARKARKGPGGRAYFLVPGSDSVALVDDAGVGMVDDVGHALSGKAVSCEDCVGPDGESVRLVGLLPDGAVNARVVLVDGTREPLDVEANVYVQEFKKSAGSLPAAIEFEIGGVVQTVDAPVPHDVLDVTCGPPPGAPGAGR